ncbi:hypothetical protein MRX96_016198 [Rhipicephalus microplus]
MRRCLRASVKSLSPGVRILAHPDPGLPSFDNVRARVRENVETRVGTGPRTRVSRASAIDSRPQSGWPHMPDDSPSSSPDPSARAVHAPARAGIPDRGFLSAPSPTSHLCPRSPFSEPRQRGTRVQFEPPSVQRGG